MTCTCAGIAPGYPQHEWWCGLPEDDGCGCGQLHALAGCRDHGHLANEPDEDVDAA
jgi:hypothetical protein